MGNWYWTSTPNGTKQTGDASYVRIVGGGGDVDCDDCGWGGNSVRPFYITTS